MFSRGAQFKQFIIQSWAKKEGDMPVLLNGLIFPLICSTFCRTDLLPSPGYTDTLISQHPGPSS